MRNSFRLLSISLLLAFTFFSCSMFENLDESSGDLSFELGSDIIRRVAEDLGDEGEQRACLIEVQLTGDYSKKKSVSVSVSPEEDDIPFSSKEIKFNSVPVGKKVSAEVKIYKTVKTGHSDYLYKTPVFKGKSESIRIREGKNTLTLKLMNYFKKYPVAFTLTMKDGGALPEDLESVEVFAFDAGSSQVTDFYNHFISSSPDHDDYADFSRALYSENEGYGYWSPTSNNSENTITIDQNAGTINLTSSGMSLSQGANLVFVALAKCSVENEAMAPDGLLYIGCPDVSSLDALNASAIVPSAEGLSHAFKLTYILPNLMVPYIYNANSNSYSFYPTYSLKDFNPAYAQSISSSKNSFAFDSKGSLYILTNNGTTNQIISNKTYTQSDSSGIGGKTLSLISIDTTTDDLYAFTTEYAGDASNFHGYIYKLSLSGNSFNSETYPIGIDPVPNYMLNLSCFAINNKNIYIPYIEGSQIKIHHGTLGNTPSNISLSELVVNAEGTIFSSAMGHIQISDIYYSNGDLYILLRCAGGKFSNTLRYVASCGAVIKYNITSGTSSVIGYAPEITLNSIKTAIKRNSGNYETIVKTENPTNYWTNVFDTSGAGGYKIRANYNNSALPHFVGPEKFIAIKPKKLVISDTGMAVYTNSEGLLARKKVNRVVELDLKALSMENSVKSVVDFEFRQTPTENFDSGPHVNLTFTFSGETDGYFYDDESNSFTHISSGQPAVIEVRPFFLEN